MTELRTIAGRKRVFLAGSNPARADIERRSVLAIEAEAAVVEREALWAKAEQMHDDGAYTDQEWGAICALFYVERVVRTPE